MGGFNVKIKEVIVVEGKDDTARIKEVLHADTIETNGSAVGEVVIEQIRHAQEKRGVIVFTDPDYPGKRIRQIVSDAVPGCKHAFLPRHEAISHKGLGVEHATPEAILAALENIYEEMAEPLVEITKSDLIKYGLIGRPDSKSRREKLGLNLNIGYANAKQLYKRLTMFHISREEFLLVMEQIEQEEIINE